MSNGMLEEVVATLIPGVIDTVPYTGMKASVLLDDANGVEFKKIIIWISGNCMHASRKESYLGVLRA